MPPCLTLSLQRKGKVISTDEADVEILELPGSDRKREKSPEIEGGDVKRLCATLETQLPSVLEKLHEAYQLTEGRIFAGSQRENSLGQADAERLVRTGPVPWK